MKESTSMIHEAQAKLKVTCSGGNDTPLWTFWLELLSSLPQLKTQPHAASIPALRFLEDDKVDYVRGFFRGEDNSCLLRRPSLYLLCFMRQIATPNH